MAILNPDHLLEQAEFLLQPRPPVQLVRQADRRRAISAAYYAVFHFLLAAVADEFAGKTARKTARYALIYRSVDHVALGRVCAAVSREKLAPEYQKYVPENGLGPNIQEFASLVLDLKEKRHSADYDPSHLETISDAQNAIVQARSAIQRFKKATLQRRKAFLTLLIFKPRA